MSKPVSNVAVEGFLSTAMASVKRYAAIRVAEILGRQPEMPAKEVLMILRREAAAAALK
jgi:hypothetical protein